MIINQIERKFVWLGIDIAVFVILIIALILNLITLSSEELPLEYLEEIQQNWKLKPIQDIKVKTENQCPYGYEILVFDQWPGTIEGCNCQGGKQNHDRHLRNLDDDDHDEDHDDHGKEDDKEKEDDDDDYKQMIYPTKCSSKQLRKGCVDISPNELVNITYWDGVQLCVQRITQIHNYKGFLENSNEEKGCRPNFHPCGELDTLKQTYCLRNKEACPINHIQMTLSPNIPDSVHTYDTIKLNNFYLHTSRDNSNGSLIVSFKLSEGNICINPKEIDNKYDPYALDPNANKYKCSTSIHNVVHDNRYSLFSAMKKKDIYQQNNIMNKIESLPDYPMQSIEQNVNLYYRNYIGCEKECVEEKDLSLISSKDIVDNWRTAKGFQVATSVFIFITIAFFIVVVIIKACKKYKLTTCTNICEGILILLSLFIFIMAVAAYCELNSIDLDFDCDEDISELWMHEMMKDIKRNKRHNVVIFLFALIPLLLYPIDCLLNVICKSKETIVPIEPIIHQRKPETYIYEKTNEGNEVNEKYAIELPVIPKQETNNGNKFNLNKNNTATPNPYNEDKKSMKSDISAPAFPTAYQNNEGLNQQTPTTQIDLIDNTNTSHKKEEESVIFKKPSNNSGL